MIIVEVFSGLGNQMYQYALYRALQKKVGEKHVYMNKRKKTNRPYELHHFCVKEHLPPRESMGKIRFKELRERKIDVYEPKVFDLTNKDSVRVEGHWQQERYFSSVCSELREELQPKDPLGPQSMELLNVIDKDENSVSLHIRRGDYLKVNFPICPLEYYQAAEKIIADKVSQPHFYIFSDDMAWVKENLHLNFPCTFVDFNRGSDSWQDMVLMSHCHHHIIANSTFSWWGAWLGNAPDKIVISPKTWFCNVDPRKMGPADWIYI